MMVGDFQSNDDRLRQLLLAQQQQCLDQAAHLTHMMQDISRLQRSILDVKARIKLHVEALVQQKTDLSHLDLVQRLPDAYEAFCAEINRRRAYQDVVARRVKAVNADLLELREREIGRRQAFLQDTGPFLPPCFVSIFVPSLFKKPQGLSLDTDAQKLPDLSTPGPHQSSSQPRPDVDAAEVKDGAAEGGAMGGAGSVIFTANPDDNEPAGDEDDVKSLRLRNSELELELAALRAQLKHGRLAEPSPSQQAHCEGTGAAAEGAGSDIQFKAEAFDATLVPPAPLPPRLRLSPFASLDRL